MTSTKDADQKSQLKKKPRISIQQMLRLVDSILNICFNLTTSSAYFRMGWLVIFLLLAGFAVSLMPYSWSEWSNYLRQFFLSLFNTNARISIINSLFELVKVGIRSYFNPYVLWYAPTIFLPIYFAYQAASFYLADIFELDRVSIARKFIRQVALTGGRNVIRITEGDIAPEDRDSPIVRIGGPGKVIVSLDSVALFEKADGRPHIIGPTEKEPKRKATLEGFERFRQALDLRDQFIDLRDIDGKKSAIQSRSLDGIPVSATDVRLMFSIHRGGQEPTPEMRYPFAKEAVEKQVYRSTAKVTPYSSDPSTHNFDFESSMLSLVRRQLSTFMSRRNLTEYLANISMREIKAAEEQEKLILEEARSVLGPLESFRGIKQTLSSPQFTQRRQITDLFDQFTENFTEEARERGIELHWIGIGTWDVPVELVLEKHVEAWKMSQENSRLNQEMDKVRNKAKALKILAMIQNVPLGVYQQRMSNIADRKTVLKELLWAYHQQLNDNFETLRDNRKLIPPTLVAAISLILRLYGRFVPPPPPPAPITQRERELYETLLKKIVFFDVVERLIELEFIKSPNASREEALENINNNWDLDIAGKWRL